MIKSLTRRLTIKNPVVKNPLSNAGDMGLIPGWGTKVPCVMGQLSPHALGPMHHN